ncbi:Hypothetical protein PENO1_080750 [Penicillium occitanis (nom. inval.)]|nr:Hypothetical protein PENO1_080750 [Penicillium occitanis (nom. inval.)]PCH04628.1 hypothetical protein PENOC_032870 [Penicillium occitanis (nom. inval.)]
MELEEGFIASPWKRINQFYPDGRLAYETGYIFKYPEIKYIDENTGAETWSIRQTGVYQRVGTPNIDKENSYQALCIDITEDLAFDELYESLSSLHNLEKRLAPLKSIFPSTWRILQLLIKLNTTYTHPDKALINERLENMQEIVNSFDDNLQYLMSRIASISSLLSNTISLKNENTSTQVSNSMLKYNMFTVDDSATVRVITLVTLIYLPPTSVSVYSTLYSGFDASD